MIFLFVFLFFVIILILAILFGASDLHFHRKPKDGKIRVACVGDSITNGCFLFPCPIFSYPARLQKMLGKKYHVENYGLNGRTLQITGDKPYSGEKECRNSLKFQPDIVVIILGSNDTKDKNWISREQFADQYEQLIQSYRELESSHVIYLCTVPWSVNSDNFIGRLTNDCIAERMFLVSEAVKDVGKKTGLQVIDLYSVFKDRRQLLCHDDLHPSRKGAKVIAGMVCAKISESETDSQI